MAYSNSDVAHNFAHQTGNKKNGSNLFYKVNENGSSTIYSYGTHFGISHILEPSKYGPFVCLFTLDNHSNSTAKHIHHVSSAVSHFEKIYVPEPVQNYVNWNGEIEAGPHRIDSDLQYFNNELNDLIKKHIRARKYSYIDDIQELIQKVKNYADLFNCKHKLFGKIRTSIYDDIQTESEILKTFFSDSEIQKVKDRKRERNERIKAEKKKQLKRFREFKANYLRNRNYIYLRVNGEVIETSKGLKFSQSDAKLAWAALQIAKKDNKTIERPITISTVNNQVFQVEKVTPNYIKSGCHTIKYNEAKRVAKQLNW